MPTAPDNRHTSDGVEITPGLWVWDNNLNSVQVDPAQFVNPSPLTGIGGQYWDGWYNMLDGKGERAPIMNSERIATMFEGRLAADFPGMSWREVKTFVAVVYNDDGTVLDHTWNWESAQNYALHEGKKVKAVKGDGHMSREEVQRLCDAERDRYRDCFGITDTEGL